jgi:hypothetical protein
MENKEVKAKGTRISYPMKGRGFNKTGSKLG